MRLTLKVPTERKDDGAHLEAEETAAYSPGRIATAATRNRLNEFTDMTALNAAQLLELSGRQSITDIACPHCGPNRRAAHNQIRKVMRVWNDGNGFLTYHCERCGESGWAIDQHSGSTDRPRRQTAPIKPETTERAELAAVFWSRRRPARGSLAQRYLQSRDCYIRSDAIAFLPARGDHGPAMIARFGFSGEVTGVHLTRLAPDGRGKAGTDKDKFMLGPSQGQPIIVQDNLERLDLFIAEGIEDAASIAVATGLTCWAAGSAGRIAALMPLTRGFDNVFVAADNDFAGERALQRAREIRPDVIHLKFGNDADANDVLRRSGSDGMLAIINSSFNRTRSLIAGDHQKLAA